MKTKAIYIPQIDGKDLWIANEGGCKSWITLTQKNGSPNFGKYRASFDYSLDLLKLREVYEKVYRNNRFSRLIKKKEYSDRIINVTFEYGVKEYNRTASKIYQKLGYECSPSDIKDCAFVKDGILVAIKVGAPVSNPLPPEILGKYFFYKDGQYYAKSNIKTVAGGSAIRTDLYENGFNIGNTHYVRWKRSSGSARVGKCLFIDERLYKGIHKWETCGLNVKAGDQVDLAAFEAYSSLTSSSIIDTVEIKPENILVIDDWDSSFEEDVISVEEHNGELTSEDKVCTVTNSIFDGQSLIDPALMGDYKDKGMILLRNRFFKSCAFNCNIQHFFETHGIVDPSQLNGFTLAKDIKDVLMITTPNSIKYLKFGSLEEWLKKLETKFGVVKHEKQTHYMDGEMVQAHYQLINSIQMTKSEVSDLLKPTFDFMNLVKKDPAVLRHWIDFDLEDEIEITPVKSKTDVIYKLMSVNEKFCQTELYNDFKQDFLKAFTKNLKCGHVLVNGNYSTLCGNPVEMLYHSIGKFSGESLLGVGNVYSTRFPFGASLLASRSPHITFSNVLITHNSDNAEIREYMNPTPEILYVNSIGENILQRLAGCDFDSDTVMITDNEVLLKAALKNINKFKVAVCNVEGTKKKRRYLPSDMADLDIKTSKNLIGDIINVSQELNTTVWDMLANGASIDEVHDIYLDICKLSIMSNIEIDKAKKEFVIDNGKELDKIRAAHEEKTVDGKKIKPNFFGHLAKRKGYYDPSKKSYKKHKTSMDYLQTCVNSFRMSREGKIGKQSFIPFSDVIDQKGFNSATVNEKDIALIIEGVEKLRDQTAAIYSDSNMTPSDKHQVSSTIRQEFIEFVGEKRFSRNTMIALLRLIEKDEYKKYKRLIFYTLFGYPNTSFYNVIISSKGKIPELIEDPYGELEIFGKKFTKISV